METRDDKKEYAEFGRRLRRLREKKGLSQLALAKELGMAQQTYQGYETGKRKVSLHQIQKFAQYFEVTTDYLAGTEDTEDNRDAATIDYSKYDNIRPIKLKKIPLLGEIACGEPIYADQDHESYILAGEEIEADFALLAKGDSMIGARINDGDAVFIRRQSIVDNGEIAAIIIEDEATLKRVYLNREEGRLMLTAENPAYEPLVYVGEELNQIHILGKAVYFQSKVK